MPDHLIVYWMNIHIPMWVLANCFGCDLDLEGTWNIYREATKINMGLNVQYTDVHMQRYDISNVYTITYVYIYIYLYYTHTHVQYIYNIYTYIYIYIYIDIRFAYIEWTSVCHLTMVGNRCQPISIWTVLLIETWRSILLWGMASASVPCWLILSQQGRQRLAHVSYIILHI